MTLRPYSVELLVRVRVPVIAESSQAAAQLARARAPEALRAASGLAVEVGVSRPVRGPADAERTSDPSRPLMGTAAFNAVRRGEAPTECSVMGWLRYAQGQGEQVEDPRQGRLW